MWSMPLPGRLYVAIGLDWAGMISGDTGFTMLMSKKSFGSVTLYSISQESQGSRSLC